MREEVATSILAHPRFLVALWLHTERDPPAAQWNTALAELVALRKDRKIAVDRVRTLVITEGGAPNAAQRAQLIRDFNEGLPNKLAVVTTVLSNPVKRGIATALAWVNPSVRFYQPAEFLRALDYLDLGDQRDAINLGYQKLKLRLGPLRVLHLVPF